MRSMGTLRFIRAFSQRTSGGSTQLKPTVASPHTHTMGTSLTRYLQMKVHPDIAQHNWRRISVVGRHVRDPPARRSPIEKSNKPFNWQRPTTLQDSKTDLKLCCYPGEDYVAHYASIIATYLSLQKRDTSVVAYLAPSGHESMQTLLNSNLADLGPIDIAVVGYVHGLTDFTKPDAWTSGGPGSTFAWQTLRTAKGHTVAFLGCRVSFWGDIAGNLIRALRQLSRVKCVLYIGKLGSLRAEHTPNAWLATGSTSHLRGQTVTWDNPLERFTKSVPSVVSGRHCSLASVLDETTTWFEDRRASFDWVDPEIGHMAKASMEGGTEFGYLHVVSDNLARKYAHDLSNERMGDVVRDRRMVMADVQRILKEFLDSWPRV